LDCAVNVAAVVLGGEDIAALVRKEQPTPKRLGLNRESSVLRKLVRFYIPKAAESPAPLPKVDSDDDYAYEVSLQRLQGARGRADSHATIMTGVGDAKERGKKRKKGGVRPETDRFWLQPPWEEGL
jgi:hypothetical protein